MTYDRPMIALVRMIAVLLALTFGLTATLFPAEASGMMEHQPTAMVDHAMPSDECPMCTDNEPAMAGFTCFISCIGVFVEGAPEPAFKPCLCRFEALTTTALEGRLRPPDPYPPKRSGV